MQNNQSMVGIYPVIPFIDKELVSYIRNLNRTYLHDPVMITPESAFKFLENNPQWHMITYDKIPVGYFRIKFLDENTVLIGADIAPQYQGKKIAQQAYPLMIEKLKNQSVNKLKLEVLSFNKRAIHIYKKLGFIEVSRKPFSNDFIDNIESIEMELMI